MLTRTKSTIIEKIVRLHPASCISQITSKALMEAVDFCEMKIHTLMI